MYVQDWFVRYNDYRPFRNTFFNKVVGNLSKITGLVGKYLLPVLFRISPSPKFDPDSTSVVVCMTSFPIRIPNLWIVLESILRQEMQPQKVLLYLSEIQFGNRNDIEKRLIRYIKMGLLEIKWVKEDYRSYKKFWYFLKENPNKPFITLDDDIIYESNTIIRLVSEANKHINTVPACYCYKIRYNSDKNICPYNDWEKQTRIGDCGNDIFFGSGGGTFFPIGSLVGADVDFDTIRKICPFADDIWLNAYVRLNGYKVLCVKNRRSVVSVFNKHNVTLSHENLDNGRNDEQLRDLDREMQKMYGFSPFNFYVNSNN